MNKRNRKNKILSVFLVIALILLLLPDFTSPRRSEASAMGPDVTAIPVDDPDLAENIYNPGEAEETQELEAEESGPEVEEPEVGGGTRHRRAGSHRGARGSSGSPGADARAAL